jgi:hypothetical protein
MNKKILFKKEQVLEKRSAAGKLENVENYDESTNKRTKSTNRAAASHKTNGKTKGF